MAEPFAFSEIQANHILDMTLGRLTRLGRSELEEEMAKLRRDDRRARGILGRPGQAAGVIADELAEIKKKFADPRRTVITHDPGEMGVEDLIEDEDLVITMTRAGYIKSVAAASFRTQGRGGRGVQGARLKEEDLVAHVVHTTACRTSCCSPTAAGSTGCGPTRSRRRSAPRGARLWSTCCPSPPTRRSRPSSATRDFDSGGYLIVRHQGRAGEEDGVHRVRQVPARGVHRH